MSHASAAAKEHCAKLKAKADKLSGKARKKKLAKYRACLKSFDDASDPGGAGTAPGGGGTPTVPGDDDEEPEPLPTDDKALARELLENHEFTGVSDDGVIRFCDSRWWRRPPSTDEDLTVQSGSWDIVSVERRANSNYIFVTTSGFLAQGTVIAVSETSNAIEVYAGDGAPTLYTRGPLTGPCSQ